jgi:hypothetical protein
MARSLKKRVLTVAAASILGVAGAWAVEVDPSMILYMPFDKIDAEVATDFSDFGNHGELVGDAVISDENARFGGALELEPPGHVLVPSDPSLNLQNMTLMFWCRFDAEPDPIQTGIERTSGWGAGEYNLNGDYNGAVILQVFDLDDGCDDELQVGNVVDAEWHHVAGTYDSEEIVIYIDGKEARSGPCEGEIADVDAPLYIGTRGGSGRPTQGAYDEIRIYNRALDEDEIETIMNEGPVELLAVDPRDRVAETWGALKSGIPIAHE